MKITEITIDAKLACITGVSLDACSYLTREFSFFLHEIATRYPEKLMVRKQVYRITLEALDANEIEEVEHA